MRYVVCDLDDTLSNARRRDNLLKGGCPHRHASHLEMTDEDWELYHQSCHFDPLRNDVWECVNNTLLMTNCKLLIATSRPEWTRARTNGWLSLHKIPYEYLAMRPNNDKRSSPELKIDLVSSLLGSEWHLFVPFVYDDHPGVCEAFAKHGVTSIEIERPQ